MPDEFNEEIADRTGDGLTTRNTPGETGASWLSENTGKLVFTVQVIVLAGVAWAIISDLTAEPMS